MMSGLGMLGTYRYVSNASKRESAENARLLSGIVGRLPFPAERSRAVLDFVAQVHGLPLAALPTTELSGPSMYALSIDSTYAAPRG